MKYSVFMTLKYSKDWLKKPRSERNRFNDETLGPILTRYHDRVSIRFFDAEAFCADSSDFALFECSDLKDYYFLMEELRDTSLFQDEWLTVTNIFVGIEDGFKEFEAQVGIT